MNAILSQQLQEWKQNAWRRAWEAYIGLDHRPGPLAKEAWGNRRSERTERNRSRNRPPRLDAATAQQAAQQMPRTPSVTH